LSGRGVTVMRIQKNADFDYIGNCVDRKNGYVQWVEKDKLLKKLNLFIIRARVLAIPLFAISAKSKIQELKNLRVTELVLLVSAVLCISLFVLLPLREIIRLMVLSGGKADGRCILLTGPGRHSIYNGFVDRKRIVISLLLPGILFCGVLTTAMCLTWGVLQLFFQFLLIVAGCIVAEDLYLSVYCIKHINKNDVVFGKYKKNAI